MADAMEHQKKITWTVVGEVLRFNRRFLYDPKDHSASFDLWNPVTQQWEAQYYKNGDEGEIINCLILAEGAAPPPEALAEMGVQPWSTAKRQCVGPDSSMICPVHGNRCPRVSFA